MNGQELSGTCRTCIIVAALFAGLFANAQLAGQVKTGEAGAAQPGAAFRDCPECPEMVVVPEGNFTMGSSGSEKVWATKHGGTAESVSDESPQHNVSLPSFALGKYDVTRGEYAAFVRDTGYPAGGGCFESSMPKSNKRADGNWQNPGFEQTDRDPVTCVSWEDARAYIAWLNGKVSGAKSEAGPYRLPSEAEWEYAARAGTTTRFWWGDNDDRTAAHAWYKDNSDGKTHAVGLKPANPFGLYDMVGNVWQWTEDCYADNYAKAPINGSAAESPDGLRSATRERNPADFRDVVMGFRVAKTLP